jgi:hypothetical protein
MGSKSITATRVAGNEPLKITTPIKPLIQPLAALFIPMLLFLRYRAGSLAVPETVRYS